MPCSQCKSTFGHKMDCSDPSRWGTSKTMSDYLRYYGPTVNVPGITKGKQPVAYMYTTVPVSPPESESISLRTLQTDDVAVVELTSPRGLKLTGSSKRRPGDHRNPTIGRNLATVRALRAYADELETRTADAIENNQW